MRVLVTGGAGQLATDLARLCSSEGDDVFAPTRNELDVTDARAVANAVDDFVPDLVVNCAAWTAVDACESDEARAFLINATAVEHLASAAQRTGAHLVQVSTDYVFDGEKSSAYVEDDEPNPQSVYGASKLAGEIAASTVGATVVRTSWVCSAHGGNMVATILRLADQHPTLQFVSDQRGNPTFTADLAAMVRRLGIDRLPGLVHATNSGGDVSWYEFAHEVLRAAGQDPARVEPITTADLLPQRPAKRPANSVLENARLETLGYEPLRDFRAALAETIPAYRAL